MGNIASIILAAGFSSRMQGLFKPLLPLDFSWPKPKKLNALESLIQLHISCGIKSIFVVIGTHQNESIIKHIEELQSNPSYENKIHLVQNNDAKYGMFNSVCKGLQALKAYPKHFSHFFMHPVDIALVRYCTLQKLIQAKSDFKDTVLIPSYQAKRGHPPLIPTIFIEQILAHNGEHGLQGVLKNFAIQEICTADSHVLLDMDTSHDYEVMQQKALRQHLLEPQEAWELLHCLGIAQKGLAHAKSVAKVAVNFASQYTVKFNNYPIDIQVTEVGAILHDMCKFEPRHEQAAAEALCNMGLHALAPLVAKHNDCQLPDHLPISEKELIYLADKYVYGSELISLEERFIQKLDFYAHIPEAVMAIKARLARAQKMEKRVACELNIHPFALATEALKDNIC